MREWVTVPTAAGMRADAWLSEQLPEASRTQVRDLLAEGALLRNGRPCRKGERIVPAARYVLLHEPKPVALAPNAALPLNVIYTDDALIAVSKPAGMNCQPNAPTEQDTLANALLVQWPELSGIGDGPLTCGILHRIDRDTSGLVLAARTQQVYSAMRKQFSAHTIEKHYWALAEGNIHTPGRLEHWLAHNPRCPGRMIDASQWQNIKRPMRAETAFRPTQTVRIAGRVFTLLDVSIRTGVTHQIRAQLSLAGMPILGDRRYGGFLPAGFERHFLHAASIVFTHPKTGQACSLKAPLTPELEALLNAYGARKGTTLC